MATINLSYLITTKNKLPYLKNRLPKLLEIIQEDEEILVADGGSTDGTLEYLESIKNLGKIQYLVSEQDTGESHAINKLFFAAKGQLCKQITDDDIFHYPTIQSCKKFMLEHPEIDMMGSNGGFKNQHLNNPVRPLIYDENYQEWLKTHKPFSFCGLGIIFRKSSLPITGLWNPSFRRADAEFSLRVTSGKAKIAWYTGHSFVNVSNPQSVSIVYIGKIKKETDRLNKFYLNKNPDSFFVEKFKITFKKIRGVLLSKNKQPSSSNFAEDWPELFSKSEKYLDDLSKQKPAEFLWNKI